MLKWPIETIAPIDQTQMWHQSASNIALDFHGDPLKAGLAIFSDGNHHMALLPALKRFYADNPEVKDIFFATTPPAPIVSWVRSGALQLGNLVLSVKPHVFISPPHVLDRLQEDGLVASHRLLACSQGSVLLIRHGNPKGIDSIEDLMRNDVRLFISNRDTETVSYEGYRQTLEKMAENLGIAPGDFSEAVFGPSMVQGHRIHHREAPEAVAQRIADAAIVYYHLALRYTRIFPDILDFIPLGGSKESPSPPPENPTSRIHIGLVSDGGLWGKQLLEFMKSRTVERIYSEHGLRVPTIGVGPSQ